MKNLIFISKAHEVFFLSLIALYPSMDIYRKVFFYVMGLTYETRAHIQELYNFQEARISPENMGGAWQTYTTRLVCRMAYNLYNGYCDEDTPDDYTPYYLFCCNLAPYFVSALQMLRPEYFGGGGDEQ